MMGSQVLGADVWDRPIVQFNYTQLNATLQLLNNTFYDEINNLQIQITNNSNSIVDNTNLILQVNTSLWNNFQYYYTSTEIDNIFSNYYNITEIDNQFNNYYNITEVNNLLLDKLNTTDQRYNDTLLIQNNTQLILNINTTLNQAINTSFSVLNSTLANLTTTLNDINNSIKQPAEKYLSYNSTHFYVNETQLNQTINIIAKNKLETYTFTINTIGGVAYNVSNIIIEHLITEIRVIPNSSTTKYDFEATTYPSLNIIDKNRMKHTGTWDIEKNYGINESVAINITDATVDEEFNIIIYYINNGLEI